MGNSEANVERLRRVRSLYDCSVEELVAIDDLMSEVAIGAGEALTVQGDAGRDFIMILEGHASVERDGVEIAGVMEGSFVGEMSLLDRTTQSATVIAMTPLRACVLSSAEFHSLLDRAPTLKAKVERAAAERRSA